MKTDHAFGSFFRVRLMFTLSPRGRTILEAFLSLNDGKLPLKPCSEGQYHYY